VAAIPPVCQQPARRRSAISAEDSRGHEVIITDRGVPVARLMGLNTTATLERLTAEGVISRPESSQRPTATGGIRPRPRRPLSDRVSEDRR
jgi:antitoxin (DNA-binding transcriptional repressor) of toxin-antitoxin stability system